MTKYSDIAVVGDVQLDLYPSLSRPDSQYGSSRLSDIVNAMLWVGDTAQNAKCHSIVVVGDFFNNRNAIDLRLIDAAERIVRRWVEDNGLDVFLLVGNHDAYLRNSKVTSLKALSGWATIVDTTRVVRIGEYECGFIPWHDDLEQIKMGIDTVAKRNPVVVFGHALVEGAVPTDRAVPLQWFEKLKNARILFGDVHDPGKHGVVEYVGSPLQFNFGDAGGERGFKTLRLSKGRVVVNTIINDFSPRFHVINDIGPSAAIQDVRRQDYVRIRTEDAEFVNDIQSQLAPTTHVETTMVDIEDIQPRLNVSVREPRLDVITRFVKQQVKGLEIENAEETEQLTARLIGVGRDIIEEAENV